MTIRDKADLSDVADVLYDIKKALIRIADNLEILSHPLLHRALNEEETKRKDQ